MITARRLGPGVGAVVHAGGVVDSARHRARRITPGHPEQNGSHEQFHAVLKAETTRPPAATARARQRRFTRFCREYNHERPHEALAQAGPATCYQSSPRRLPRRLPPREYPGHADIRRVDQNGYVSWRRPLFVSVALAGEAVAFEEVDDGIWTVTFATVVLGRFDERQHRIQPIIQSAGLASSLTPRLTQGTKNDDDQKPNQLLPMSLD